MGDPSASTPLPDDASQSPLVATCDADGRIVEWNAAFAAACGVSNDGIKGRRLRSLVDDDRLCDAVTEAATGGTATVTTAPNWLPGAHAHEFTASAVGDGDETRVVLTGEPVGPQQRAVERMADAFFAVDRNWRVTYLNERAADVLAGAMGHDASDPDALIGSHLWSEIQQPEQTTLYEEVHGRMDTADPLSYEDYYPPLGAWFEVRAYPSKSGLSVYFRDVTERHEQLEALRERERVLQRVHEITAATDMGFETKVQTLLEVGCGILDVDFGTLSRIRGDDYIFEYVHAPEGADLKAGDVVAADTTSCERAAATEQTLVLANIDRDAPRLAERAGNADWGISCYLGAPTFVDGDPYGTFCFYDMDARDGQFDDWEVTLVDLLAQWVSYELTSQHVHDELARRNEQLEEFASIVSHDLRNPLGVVSGSLDLAERTGDDQHFERGRDAIERMETLIEDLLSLSRAGDLADDPQSVDLSVVVSNCWETAAAAEASLVTDAHGTIRADETRLKQLFENLFRNAVEHGGENVMVEVGDLDDGFYVADDGPGIPVGDRDTVFDAGHSTDADGTGFGLYIVEQVATAHGWSVTVTESESGGARFEFTDVAFEAT